MTVAGRSQKGAKLEASAPNRWDANPWVWVVEFHRVESGVRAAPDLRPMAITR